MKKLLTILTTILIGLCVACTYDDSEAWDSLKEIEQEQKELADEQQEMQQQLDSQKVLLDALANNLIITSIISTSDGYVICFSDGSTIIVKHGENGDQGD